MIDVDTYPAVCVVDAGPREPCQVTAVLEGRAASIVIGRHVVTGETRGSVLEVRRYNGRQATGRCTLDGDTVTCRVTSAEGTTRLRAEVQP